MTATTVDLDATSTLDLCAVGLHMHSSHATIAAYYSSTSARCACGSTLVLLADGASVRRPGQPTWVHGGTHKIVCPPHYCECGEQRS